MSSHTAKEHSLILTFDVDVEDVETQEMLSDPALLEQLDGLADASDLAGFLGEDEIATGLRVRRAIPTLRFDREAARLVLAILFITDRAASPEEREQLESWCSALIERGWGHEFALPDALPNSIVHIASEARECVQSPSAAAMAAIEAQWPRLDFASMTAMTDADLDTLIARLTPHVVRDYTSTGIKRRFLDLHDAASAQRQRRAVSRAQTPKVGLDNLDALDDLPKDSF